MSPAPVRSKGASVNPGQGIRRLASPPPRSDRFRWEARWRRAGALEAHTREGAVPLRTGAGRLSGSLSISTFRRRVTSRSFKPSVARSVPGTGGRRVHSKPKPCGSSRVQAGAGTLAGSPSM